MQRMETDTAAQGIVDGSRQQVIDIDRKTRQQQQVTLPPAFAPEQRDEDGRGQEVERDMKDERLPRSGNFRRLVEAQLPATQGLVVMPQRTVQRSIAGGRYRCDLLRVVPDQP